MEAKVRIYVSYRKEQERDPVAILHIGDCPDQAGWLFPLATETDEPLFGLKGIDIEREDVRERLVTVLSQPVRVRQAVSHSDETSRTRLVFATNTLPGTAAHW